MLLVFANSGFQHMLCCVFLCLVYPMLPVALDCPFLIAPSVFSNVYFTADVTVAMMSKVCCIQK